MADNVEKGYQQDDIPPPYNYSENPQLPSYTQANPAEPPPSYESLFGQIKNARGQSSGNVDFFKRFIFLILGTVGCTICLGLIMAIPVSMIVIGSMYLHDCPAERYIPIYLVVMGCFGVLQNLTNLFRRIKNRDEQENEDEKKKCHPFGTLLSTFMFVWFIAGNVWIFRLYGHYDPSDPNASNYCYGTLYLFAFWMTIATYLFMLTVCCCTCLGGMLAWCCSSN